MLKFHLITLFPEACEAYLSASILGRARKQGKIFVDYHTPRDFVDNKWGKVDESPYGGGPGMVMTALPVVRALAVALGYKLLKRGDVGARKKKGKVALVWFSPSAPRFTNKEADKLASYDDIVFVCGRYEGIDDRALTLMKQFGTVKKYSVGEATLTGAELPAMSIIDAVTRRLPGVLGKDESVEERRVASHAVYTRPEVITFDTKKYKVPPILLSGHAAKIEEWRKKGK
jgi:tRNA (guanine37-N1)-methyltransferase